MSKVGLFRIGTLEPVSPRSGIKMSLTWHPQALNELTGWDTELIAAGDEVAVPDAVA